MFGKTKTAELNQRAENMDGNKTGQNESKVNKDGRKGCTKRQNKSHQHKK